jgi:hypothetical protein
MRSLRNPTNKGNELDYGWSRMKKPSRTQIETGDI